MGRGYAEGPAVEEAERRRAEQSRPVGKPEVEPRSAVYGSTADAGEPHFLGWLGEVDPDALFASGDAWGLTIRRRLP